MRIGSGVRLPERSGTDPRATGSINEKPYVKMRGAKRREVIAALVAKGVNKFTAATQYQL